jgi:NAD(P)-dependent dehydrogenase (short-subunit alcohol dehydrogenase family)
MKLEGRTCIVTGASGGLGSHLVVRFWQEGASLLLTGRNTNSINGLARSLPPAPCSGQKLVTFPVDLAEPNAAKNLLARAKDEFASLTILVNNAAIQGPIGPIWENNLQEWEDTIRLNLLAPARLCALALPWMLANSYGKIMNISGGGSTAGRPRFSAYSAAKAGLVRLTETLAQEVGAAGVDVNAIAPGTMFTQMTKQILDAGSDRVGASEYEKIQEQAKAGDAAFHRAADLATFLASSESDGITGRLISAVWDRWQDLAQRKAELKEGDVYTLRRIVPKDRGLDWNNK